MPKQPNILFIMADQLAAKHIGCYGSGVNSTPTLDALAERGVRFTRNYATCPVCGPNRATFLTGRSMQHHGVVTNNLKVDPREPTYPKLLKSAGYHVAGFGKFHFHSMQLPLPGDMAEYGFDESVISEDPKLGPWLDWIEREHPEHYETAMAVAWPMPWAKEYGPDKRDLLTPMLAARGKVLGPLMEASGMPAAYPSPLPMELHQTRFITDLAMESMERRIDGADGRPWFCYVSYVDPHDPYDPPAPYDTMYDPAAMPPPVGQPEGALRIGMLDRARDTWGMRDAVLDKDKIQQLRAWFHGSLRFIDDEIGRMLAMLEAKGVLDDTIVVFTTDHGEMLGDFGLMTKGIKHQDAGIRCPLIVAGPGVGRGEQERLTTTLDFVPTFCEWAGLRSTPPLEGKSFAAACADPPRDPKDWPEVIVEAPFYVPEGNVQTIITDDGWRYTVYDEEGAVDLVNLREDPDELRSLHDDPGYAAKRLELAERLVRAQMQRGYVQQYRVLPTLGDGRRATIPQGWDLEPVLTPD